MSLLRRIAQLEEKLKKLSEDELPLPLPKFVIFGVGGAGNNCCTNLMNTQLSRVPCVKIVAANTDAWQLHRAKAHVKLLLGPSVCRGKGAGNRPELGERAAKEVEDKIRRIVDDADLVFVVFGAGGGTGSGAAPVIAEIARSEGKLVLGVCTLPFKSEGHVRWANAMLALRKLQRYVNTLIVIPNDRLLAVAPDMRIADAFRMADDVVCRAVSAIIDVVTQPGLINVDFADVERVFSAGGFSFIGIGEADDSVGEAREDYAVLNALSHPLIVYPPSKAKSCLLNVTGGPDLTLKEAEGIVRRVHQVLGGDAEIIWGVVIDEGLASTVRVTAILAGIHCNIDDLIQRVIDDSRPYPTPPLISARDRGDDDLTL